MTKTILVLASLLFSSVAYAYGAVVTIKELIAESDVIVVAKVSTVRVSMKGREEEKTATANVEAVWKGEAPATIEYVASRGWYACDTSDANEGERVVLFLAKDRSDGRLRIAHYGRGRMVVVADDERLRAETYEVIFSPPPVLNDVTLASTRPRVLDERIFSSIRRPVRYPAIDLDELERIVRAC